MRPSRSLSFGIAACAIGFAAPSCGQFFYAGLGGHVSVQNPGSLEIFSALGSRIAYVALEAGPYAGYRFGRHFAAGFSARVPLVNSNRLRIAENLPDNRDIVIGETANGDEVYPVYSSTFGYGQQPEDWGMTIRPAAQYNAHLTYIVNDRSGFFLEARLVYGGFREVLWTRRSSGSSAYSSTEKVAARKGGVYPGIGAGFMPHIGEKSFIRIEAGFDLMLLSKNSGFRYDVIAENINGNREEVTLRSLLTKGSMARLGFTYGRRF